MEVDPSIASAVATIASAIATAILLYATYHWPSGRNEHDDEAQVRKHHRKKSHTDEDDEQDQEGSDV